MDSDTREVLIIRVAIMFLLPMTFVLQQSFVLVHFVHLSEPETSHCLPFLQLFTILLLVHHSLLLIHTTLFVNHHLFVNYTLFVHNGCFACLLQLGGHMSHL